MPPAQDLQPQYEERRSKRALMEANLADPNFSKLNFTAQSEGVLRRETSRGSVMYYPGANKWQFKGKVFKGAVSELVAWLKKEGLL